MRRTDYMAQRRLLRVAIRLLAVVRPKALPLENLPNLVERKEYADDRSWIADVIAHLGYQPLWGVLNAADAYVPRTVGPAF